MSTYTPCFPPNPSETESCSFSVRLSRAHLALASVSDYIQRPPSPTSAAVDSDRVGHLRRKFRHAVAAAYRDTSSGKWAHVSELARLGCTIGRWQGVCSGSKAPHSLSPLSAGDRNDQGVVDDPHPEVNPYPRPPLPTFNLGEIRERVENWQANVASAPLSQADPDPLPSTEDAERLSPLNFPIVKRRKNDVAKAMKRKRKASPDRAYTTSRYFRGDGLADRMSHHHEAQAVNRDAGCVTPTPRSVPPGSNAELTPRSRVESPEEIVRKPVAITAPVPESIHQIAEAFLPPSFPSQLQTSTPPPCDRLIKPPVIPRADGLFLSASLPSPPPFPRSQPDGGSASQPLRTPTRSRKDIPSSASSPSPKFKRRQHQAKLSSRSDSESPPPPPPPHAGDARQRRDRDRLTPAPAPAHPVPSPLIDLRQLARTSSQRSRDSITRHSTRGAFALGSSPMTPRTARRPPPIDKGRGKARAMTTALVSPRGPAKPSRATSSPPLLALHSSSSPLTPHPHPQTQTPPLSPLPDFTRDAHAFAPAATSTQQPPGPQSEIFGLEAHGSRGSGVLGRERDVDVAAWVRDVPVVEDDADVGVDVGDVDVDVGKKGGEEKSAGLREDERGLPYPGVVGPGLGRALQVSAEMVPADGHV
ncbi:hypothetical protein H4582DRAFT_2130111 [Lactarius indigo]|nr:hypothetical protein H4582DRAFT_2130111 [Lactarius indigo]